MPKTVFSANVPKMWQEGIWRLIPQMEQAEERFDFIYSNFIFLIAILHPFYARCLRKIDRMPSEHTKKRRLPPPFDASPYSQSGLGMA